MSSPGNVKKTILYISGFPDIVGGGQRSFLLFARHIDRSRYRLAVVCPRAGEVSRELAGLGFETVFIPLPDFRRNIFKVPAYIRALRGHAAACGADLVHCDTLDTALYAGLSFLGIPVVFHARTSDTGAWLDLLVPFLCDRIICVSNAVTERFRRTGGWFQVVYNGVDAAEFREASGRDGYRSAHSIPAGAPLLGYCGQLVEEKGLKTLMTAFSDVSREIPGSRLLLVGRGPMEAELRGMAESMGLGGSVIFGGFEDNISGFISAVDVFVLPSFVKEGLARGILEAMAGGRPVIASDSGGNPELVQDGVNGFLFRAGDAAGLAAKVVRLLGDKALSAKMGEAAMGTVKARFSAESYARGVEAVYDVLLRAGSSGIMFRVPGREEVKALMKKAYLALRGLLLRSLSPLLRAGCAGASKAPRKVLVVRIDRIGDMALTTPVFRMIKAEWPECRLHLLAGRGPGALVSNDPDVDKVWIWGGSILQRLGCLAALRREGFDLAVDPMNGYEILPAALVYVVGAAARLGYSSAGREALFNIRSAPPVNVHFSQEGPHLLRSAGVRGPVPAPRLFVSQEALREADAMLSAAGFSASDIIVSVHPGGVYGSKRWPGERFAETLTRLSAAPGRKFLIIGSSDEAGLTEAAAAALGDSSRCMKAVNVSPGVLCALIRKSAVFIGNNSGPLHIAAAFGVPSVSTMGPADPVKWPPVGAGHIVLRAGLPCSPCNRGICCWHGCMKAITVDMMVKETEKLLSAGNAAKQKAEG